ncbi:MAG TPA: D-2-hydroxyacid dehydrogenase [Leucothrix mucor]|nr:D-2-hydroxyacid dehydrogenase [Leucothrix mucor]
MSKHHAVILDETTFNAGDLDLSALIRLVDSWERHPSTTKEQRFERLEQATIAIANKVVFDQALLEKLPKLKIILLTATGMDNVDREYCQQHGIVTKSVTDYCTSTVSQHVFSLILALSTKLIDYQAFTKSGEWSNGKIFSSLRYPIQELAGKTLGLIGYGSLAKGVEKLALAFDMKILISQRVGTTNNNDNRLPLNELLKQVDVLSIHCPLTPETKHLISTAELQQMKPTALLINTSRGAVIDNLALANALCKQEIAGAGIDVLDQEPPPSDHPLLADDIPNLLITPHIAWAAVEARQRVIDKVAENLEGWLSNSAN